MLDRVLDSPIMTLVVARPCAALDGVAVESPGWRVHAAAGGRGSAVYALRASGTVGGEGIGAAAADGPDDQDRARSGDGVRQGGPRGDRHRSGAVWKCSRRRSSSNRADQWRPGMTPEKLVEELDATVKVPGLTNVWVPPIRNRIDMLATGIKSPIGVKIAGHRSRRASSRSASRSRQVVKTIPGMRSASCRALTGGRYIEIDIDSARLALRTQHRRCAIGGRLGHRRREDRRDGRGTAALSDQACVIHENCAIPSRTCAASHSHRGRGTDHARYRRATSNDARDRRMLRSENARLRLGVHRIARPRSGVVCPAMRRRPCAER